MMSKIERQMIEDARKARAEKEAREIGADIPSTPDEQSHECPVVEHHTAAEWWAANMARAGQQTPSQWGAAQRMAERKETYRELLADYSYCDEGGIITPAQWAGLWVGRPTIQRNG